MEFSGNYLDFLAAFLGGVLVSFTPCVYPLIPVSAGYIGIKAGGSKLKGLSLSLVYVTGIAFIYSILGLLASLGGIFFGKIGASPITHIFVGIVIILFGLSMLHIFRIPLPNIIKSPGFKAKGYFSTLLLGLVSGLIVSPCLTPVLGSILAYLATKKNLFYGATLLLSFAYGIGLVLILAGFSAALLARLPKSGKWMLYIERLAAILLVGAGVYFILTGIRRL